MKTHIKLLAIGLSMFIGGSAIAQDEVQTVFKHNGSSGGYGAITNHFSSIGGEYANLVGIYGGWFVNKRLMIGAGAAATTNYIPVRPEYSLDPSRSLSYQYGQAGLMTEYVLGSNKTFHLVFNLFSGAGFTLQYERHDDWDDYGDIDEDDIYNENWFFVAEPGVQLEINLFKWMRVSPGISYRTTFGSQAAGLTDGDLSNLSYSATLKFGKF